MRHRIVNKVVVAAAVVGLAATANAQEGLRPLRLGEPVNGTLTAQDPKYSPRGAFHAYRLEAKAGARYVITMSSASVDSYVWVARLVGGLTETLAGDDDGSGGSDARLRFRAPAAGTYVIVAQSLEVDKLGAYLLRVSEAPPSPIATATALVIGQAREGVLDENSPVLEEEEPPLPYQLYTFTGNGERVRIAVRSGAFDASVRVTRVTASGEEEVGSDDDSGGGTDAQLILTAIGAFRIYVRPVDADRAGPFTVAITEVRVRPVVSRPLAVGQTVDATLERTDSELDDGRNFHQYTITARPGDRLVVTMRSRAFDAFLDWGRMGPAGFVSAATDDDGAGDTDAKLEIVIPADGTYLLRAHGLERGQSGAYSITVERRAK